MTSESVVEKIRKLLALAESSNPHEAALAAQRAQEMMLRHHVDAARVKDATVTVEKIAQERAVIYSDFPSPLSRIPHWHLSLMRGVARAFCCSHYYTPGRSIYLVGRESDRQVAKYMFEYLRREVERLADDGWREIVNVGQDGGVHGRTWKRGFCLGAVREINNRLYETHKPHAPASTTLPAAPVTETAMVLRNRLEEVDVWVKANLQLSSGGGGAPPPSSGYAEGRAAGRSISLGGGKGVGSGAKRLPQGAAP